MEKIILSVILSAMCICFVGCGMNIDNNIGNHITGDTYENAEQYTAGNFTYNAADVDTVEVSWRVGKVTLVESDAATLSVTESGTALEPNAQMRHWPENGTLHIQFCKSGAGFTVEDKDKYLTLELPENITLKVQSISADISADTLEQKSVTLSTTSGNIETGTITADTVTIGSVSGRQSIGDVTAGELEMSSTSGDLTAGKASVSGQIFCSTVSGKVNLQQLESEAAEIDTTGGDVDLGVLYCPNVSVNTTGGKVSLTLPASAGASVEYNSISGDLHTSLPWTMEGDLIVFGDGKYQIYVNTTGGDLEIREAKQAIR